jgi:hypothetical protein
VEELTMTGQNWHRWNKKRNIPTLQHSIDNCWTTYPCSLLQFPFAHRPIIARKSVLGWKFSVPNFVHFSAITSALSDAGSGIGF